MGPDQAVELVRDLFRQALIISAPVLVAASLTSFVLSLVQTLTSLQEQTLTTVPRLVMAATLILLMLPWFAKRLVGYTVLLLNDMHRYLG
jgi:flagellar biosynthesis protein FliQ